MEDHQPLMASRTISDVPKVTTMSRAELDEEVVPVSLPSTLRRFNCPYCITDQLPYWWPYLRALKDDTGLGPGGWYPGPA